MDKDNDCETQLVVIIEYIILVVFKVHKLLEFNYYKPQCYNKWPYPSGHITSFLFTNATS
jgi:hypothetical protein